MYSFIYSNTTMSTLKDLTTSQRSSNHMLILLNMKRKGQQFGVFEKNSSARIVSKRNTVDNQNCSTDKTQNEPESRMLIVVQTGVRRLPVIKTTEVGLQQNDNSEFTCWVSHFLGKQAHLIGFIHIPNSEIYIIMIFFSLISPYIRNNISYSFSPNFTVASLTAQQNLRSMSVDLISFSYISSFVIMQTYLTKPHTLHIQSKQMTLFCKEENDILFIYYLLERDYFEILFIICICGYTHTQSIVLDFFLGGGAVPVAYGGSQARG